MNSYTVCFELFGKKMKLTDVKAKNKTEAKLYVKDCIKFHAVEDNEVTPLYPNINELFKDFSKLFDVFK